MIKNLNFLMLTAVVLGGLVGCANVQPGETQPVQLQPEELVNNVSPDDFLIVKMRDGSSHLMVVENIDPVKITGGNRELYIKDIASVTKKENYKKKSEQERDFWAGIYVIVALIALFSSIGGGAATGLP